MPETRAILVMVPALLADLIRHVVTPRLGASGFAIVAEHAGSTGLFNATTRHRANIVLLGPRAWRHRTNLHLPDCVAVLALSPDLRIIHGPGETDKMPFTADALAQRLRQGKKPLF